MHFVAKSGRIAAAVSRAGGGPGIANRLEYRRMGENGGLAPPGANFFGCDPGNVGNFPGYAGSREIS